MSTHTISPILNPYAWKCTEKHKNKKKAAMLHSLGPLWITLLTHIRFPKSLRSTASLILSHFHTRLHHTNSLLPLRHLEPVSCKHSVFYQILQSLSSLRTFSPHTFQLIVWSNPPMAFVIKVSRTRQWPCNLHNVESEEQCAKLQRSST